MALFGKYILGGIIPIMLIGLGIFFLIYLKFFFLVKPIKTFSVLFKKEKVRGISSFSALTVALAGTLGVGNIVGVSGAIILGGPGSVFWMILSAFAAMVLKYAEIVLAHNHRRVAAKGFLGGAMYYIEDLLRGRLGKAVGAVFASVCLLNSFSMGCMLQANAVSSSFSEISSVSPVLIGVVLAILCGAVILCGVYDISPITSIIIPVMTLVYVIISLIVIIVFGDKLPSAIKLIFSDAFNIKSAGGGIFGFFMSESIRYGTMRGILSNEAGCGTAPMAHSASNVKGGAEQGIWGIIEVFVDTILLCTLTALSILCVFGDKTKDFFAGDEMKLVLASYGAAIGKAAAPVISVMVFFFAFATIICWAYYGNVTMSYLTKSKKAHMIYKLIYILCIFLGAYKKSEIIWQISDMALGTMTLINLTVLFIMRKEIKSETIRFMKTK